MKNIALAVLFSSVMIAGFSQKNRGTYRQPAASNQEIGISLGVSNYLGDLAWKGKIPIIEESNPSAFRPAGGIYYRSNFTNFTSFRASFQLGGLYGNDAQTNGDPARLNRNLHFRSVVADASVMLEWNMLPYRIGDKRKMFTPYLGIGLAGFYFNPQAQLNGRWVNLQPLGTEGQGVLDGKRKYSNFQFAIPGVFGFKANITKRIALNLEFQYRYTFTDYLDDVSSASYVSSDVFFNNYITAVANDANALAYRAIDQNFSPRALDQRGSPKAKDNYYFVLFGISYKIGKSGPSCNTFK